MNAYNKLSLNQNEDQTFQCPGGVFIYYLIFLFLLPVCLYVQQCAYGIYILV